MALLFMGVPMAVGLLACLVSLGIAWGRRRVGMLFGMCGLVGLLLTSPQLWWVTIAPLGLGATALRTWYSHDGSLTGRRMRFDLRRMFVLILLLSFMLGGTTSEYRQTQIEREVATKLDSLSSSITVSWRLDRVNFLNFHSPSLDEFERSADALQQLSQLHSLQVSTHNFPGSILERVGQLTTLRTLWLQTLTVTDNDLRPLANLHNLESLELDTSKLTDDGLVHLQGLKRLRVLNLYGADKVTPAAMAKLRAGLPRLEEP